MRRGAGHHGRLEGQECTEECRITTRDRQGPQAMDFRATATPCQLDDETYLIFCLSDISHHKRRRVLERIFFHDILNTAGGMRNLVECMMQEAPDGLRRDAEMLHDGFSVMVEEITAQRELLAAENDELITHPMTMNGLEVARMALNMHSNHEAARGKAIEMDPASEECELVSDYTLLRRVLGNMVLNALEAVRPGQAVRVGCRADQGRVRFWVRNPGVISEEARLKMFQRSFSSKGAGRGLGTYSIRLLTERYLAGKAGFSSSEEEGTEFHVSLPA